MVITNASRFAILAVCRYGIILIVQRKHVQKVQSTQLFMKTIIVGLLSL
jgi:hypothetical protein